MYVISYGAYGRYRTRTGSVQYRSTSPSHRAAGAQATEQPMLYSMMCVCVREFIYMGYSRGLRIQICLTPKSRFTFHVEPNLDIGFGNIWISSSPEFPFHYPIYESSITSLSRTSREFFWRDILTVNINMTKNTDKVKTARFTFSRKPTSGPPGRKSLELMRYATSSANHSRVKCHDPR